MDKIQELEYSIEGKLNVIRIITERHQEQYEELKREKTEKNILMTQNQEQVKIISRLTNEIQQLKAAEQFQHFNQTSNNFRYHRTGHFR